MIDTKLLRQKLIDMAMRGLLVEQRPEDGNAIDLLEQIRAEKAALIKAGKIKKEKPLPEIEEEEKPFAIPDNWCWVRLGEIVEVNPRNSLNDELEVGFMPMAMLEGGFNNHHFYEVRLWRDVKSGFTHLKNGDLAIAKITPCFQNRKSAIIKGFPNDYGAGTTEVSVLRNSTGLININYLLWMAKSESFINSGVMSFSGSVGQQRIHKDFLATYVAPLPPLAEQKRIVAALEASLKLVDTIDKDSADLDMAMRGLLVEQCPEEGNASDLLEQIRTEKAALIKEGKIKKEKPLPEIKEEEKPFAIPDSWCWVRLGNLAESIQYGYNAPAQESGRIKMVRITDIQNNAVLWENVPYCDIDEFNINTYLIKENDILFARTGGTVGKSFLVRNVLEDAIYAGYLIRTRYGCKLSSTYMKLFMESSLYWSQLRNGTNATAQPNCNGQTLSKMLVPLPPLAEQKRIVAKLEQINALIDTMLN